MDEKTCTNDHVCQRTHSRRAYLLTSPRTASNLFIKMLNLHDQSNPSSGHLKDDVLGSGYFYGAPMDFYDDNYDIGTPFDELSSEAKQNIHAVFQGATDVFVNVTKLGEREGKITVFKEHIVNMIKPALQAEIIHGIPMESVGAPWTISIDGYDDTVSASNPLLLPDQWLHTFMPTILIRHPAVAFPSEYRAEVVARQAYGTQMRNPYSDLVSTNTAVRRLYDFYRSYFLGADTSSPWPLVIDAADLIANPEPYMKHFCSLTGIDASRLRYSWPALSEQETDSLGNGAVQRFLSTLIASNTVRKEKACRVVNIDAEVASIRAEFGDEVGDKMNCWIRRALDDYEYLRSRRWTPKC